MGDNNISLHARPLNGMWPRSSCIDKFECYEYYTMFQQMQHELLQNLQMYINVGHCAQPALNTDVQSAKFFMAQNFSCVFFYVTQWGDCYQQSNIGFTRRHSRLFPASFSFPSCRCISRSLLTGQQASATRGTSNLCLSDTYHLNLHLVMALLTLFSFG